MKKTIFLCIVVLVMLLVLGITVAAVEDTGTYSVLDFRKAAGYSPDDVMLMEADTGEAEQYLYNELRDMRSVIDVSSLKLTEEELIALLNRVCLLHPDLFYVAGWYENMIKVDPMTNTVISVPIHYSLAGDPLKAAQKDYKKKINEILGKMDENWSDVEKLLFIHDYLAAYHEFDRRYFMAEEADAKLNRDAYGFLRDKKGVCQAYYSAAKALLDACGYTSTYAYSIHADHIWNLVLLDGKWYNFDVTFDDPLPDVPGQADHRYFLVSDDMMEQRMEEDQAPDRSEPILGEAVSCVTSTYDNMYWAGSSSRFVPINGTWYYNLQNSIHSTTNVLQDGRALVYIGYWQYTDWSASWPGLDACGDWLIYSTGLQIKGRNVVTGEEKIFYNLADYNFRIFGAVVDGYKVLCEESQHPGCDSAIRGDCWNCPDVRTVEISLAELDPNNGMNNCGGEGSGANLTWSLNADGVLTISGTGIMKDYAAAEDAPWYSRRSEITKVVIGYGVTSFDVDAVRECTELTAIEVEEYSQSFVAADGVLFDRDQMELICYPAGKTQSAYIIPDTVEAIGKYAFSHCESLTAVTVPENVTEIGDNAFKGCESLESIYFEGDAPSASYRMLGTDAVTLYYVPGTYDWFNYGSTSDTWKGYPLETWSGPVVGSGDCGGEEDGKNLTWTLHKDGTLTITGTGVMRDYTGSEKSPWLAGRNPVYTVVIENGVTTIGSNAFNGCDELETVTIGAGVKTIGAYAFSGCWALSDLTVGAGVEIIGAYAFSESGVETVTMGDRVKTIEECAFYWCESLRDLTIGAGVETIGMGAFAGCSALTAAVIPDGVKEIARSAFDMCSTLTDLTIGKGVKTIYERAFAGCSGLSAVTIPSGVAEISAEAFSGCRMLETVTVGTGIKTIGDRAFYNCYSLTDVYFKGAAPEIGYDPFGSGVTLYCTPEYEKNIEGCWKAWPAYHEGTNTWNDYQLGIWQYDAVTLAGRKETAGKSELECAVDETIRAFTKIMVGAYDASGKFIAAAMGTYDGSSNTVTVTFEKSLPKGCTLKAFCVDNDFAPQYKVSELSL